MEGSMKINKVSFEGTPEEFASVAPLFAEQGTLPISQAQAANPAAATDPSGGAKPETADKVRRLCLTRLPLAETQRVALRAIADSGDKSISLSQLAAKVGYK